MPFIAKNPLILPEVVPSPPAPNPGTRGIFAKENGLYEIDGYGNEGKLGGRSATYYVGALDTKNTIGCDYICEDSNKKRFNDIIDAIMLDIESDSLNHVAKIIVRSGTYYIDNEVNISKKCSIEFEGGFATSSPNNHVWNILADNCVFTNCKIYDDIYIRSNANTFCNCLFAGDVSIGEGAPEVEPDTGSDNSFRSCVFKKGAQVGDRNTIETGLWTGNGSSFVGCTFYNGGLNLACKDVVVKGCHFKNIEHGIKYNGSKPEYFTAHFYGNSLEGDNHGSMLLYDEVTARALPPAIEDEDVQRWNLASNIILKDFPKTWEDVQMVVRSGLAPQYFSIGDKFAVYYMAGLSSSVGKSVGITGVSVDNGKLVSGYGEVPRKELIFSYDGKSWRDGAGNIIKLADFGVVINGSPVIGDYISIVPNSYRYNFVVIGFDQEVPSDERYTHSMTLQTDFSVGKLHFDEKEATWYVDKETYPSGLAAGKYTFVRNSSTYSFTTTKKVPVGGQIRLNYVVNSGSIIDSTIETYESALSTQSIESISIELGGGGTLLPSFDESTDGKNVNSLNRTRHGSDNWAESDIRTWLNSSAPAGAWWEPKSVFDRPTLHTNINGFLYCVDPSFLSVVGDVKKTTQQGVADGYGLVASTERFFLPSRTEVFGGAERTEDGADGDVYVYYGAEYSDLSMPGDGSDTNRANGGERWWLRSASTDRGGYAPNVVQANGKIYKYSAYNGFAVLPVCAIV